MEERENKSSTTVKVVQSDDDTEFTNKHLIHYYKRKSIKDKRIPIHSP